MFHRLAVLEDTIAIIVPLRAGAIQGGPERGAVVGVDVVEVVQKFALVRRAHGNFHVLDLGLDVVVVVQGAHADAHVLGLGNELPVGGLGHVLALAVVREPVGEALLGGGVFILNAVFHRLAVLEDTIAIIVPLVIAKAIRARFVAVTPRPAATVGRQVDVFIAANRQIRILRRIANVDVGVGLTEAIHADPGRIGGVGVEVERVVVRVTEPPGGIGRGVTGLVVIIVGIVVELDAVDVTGKRPFVDGAVAAVGDGTCTCGITPITLGPCEELVV